ncbi:MAG TPA: hypothetical protein VN645_13795 [Steroidobacteraceae bacterium]|nr:hypothetical protein [Steroidobacteraceae bacterium]
MLTRRRIDFVIALLLPLMVLRGLLPAGYMPVNQNGEIRIAMCSDGRYVAGTERDTRQAPSGRHELPSDSSPCPFASAAVNAAPPATSTIAFRIESDAGIVDPAAAPIGAAAVVRVQSARGPPTFSL